MKEMQQYLGVLRQLKDFDENLSREIAAKAYQEQERIRLEVGILKFISTCNRGKIEKTVLGSTEQSCNPFTFMLYSIYMNQRCFQKLSGPWAKCFSFINLNCYCNDTY